MSCFIKSDEFKVFYPAQKGYIFPSGNNLFKNDSNFIMVKCC